MFKQKEKVIIKRDVVESKDKKLYANYYIEVEVQSYSDKTKEVVWVKDVIRMDPPRNDVNMYNVLKTVFMGETEKELIRIVNYTVDSNTGRRRENIRYEVRSDDGLLAAQLVPSKESDKMMLNALYRELKLSTEENEEESVNESEL